MDITVLQFLQRGTSMNTVQKSLFALLLSAAVITPAYSFDAITGAPSTTLGKVFARTGDGISYAGQSCGNAFSNGWDKTKTYASQAGDKIGDAWNATRQKSSEAFRATSTFVTKDAPTWMGNNKVATGFLGVGVLAVGVGLWALVDWYNS